MKIPSAEQRAKWLRPFILYDEMSKVELSHQVGAGTYGAVHKAILTTPADTTQTVALKKLYLKEDERGKEKNRDGFPITAIREIEILKSLKHPNIVELMGLISYATG